MWPVKKENLSGHGFFFSFFFFKSLSNLINDSILLQFWSRSLDSIVVLSNLMLV